MKRSIVFLNMLFFAGAALAQTTWNIDKEHSSINFSVAHFLVAQTAGRFKEFDARVLSQGDDFNGATVTFEAKTASICTDNEQRDHHLQSEDFLNSGKYPECRFTGKIVKEGEKYLLKGNLTIRDITRPVSFALTYNGRLKESTFHVDKAGFAVTGYLNRSDYGLKWNETFEGGRPIVGDSVTLNLNVELNRQP